MPGPFIYNPGQVVSHMKCLGKQDRDARRRFHREAGVWVLTVSPDEHYVMQCQVTLDKHLVLGAFASLDLAHIARGSFTRLGDVASGDPERDTGAGVAGARDLAKEAGVRWRET